MDKFQKLNHAPVELSPVLKLQLKSYNWSLQDQWGRVMDHLWLERSFLLVTLLCSLTLGGGGDTRTMKKVSYLFYCNNRALIFGANNSSQVAKSQCQSLHLLNMFGVTYALRSFRIFLVFRLHGNFRITSKLYHLFLELSFLFHCNCITTDFHRLRWTWRSLVTDTLPINF
jgi:hypothetical protein